MKTINFPAVQASNPARALDWRWQRAIRLVETGEYASSKRDDELTCRTTGFIRSLGRCSTERAHRGLAMREPDIFLALRVVQDGGLRRLELDGRIFAGQSDLAIGRAMGLPRPAVASYAGLFCGVRDRLHATSYAAWAAGARLGTAASAETLFLLSAHRHGPAIIEPWIDYFEHVGERHDLATSTGRQRARIELLVAMQAIDPTDPAVQRSVLRNSDLIARIEPMANRDALPVAEVLSRRTAEILRKTSWATRMVPEFGDCQTNVSSDYTKSRRATKAG